jgi:glycosyltransferase involved in cell wall biosynthesis
VSDAAVPFVSVVVPTHGRVALLRRLLDSLVAQDWPRDRYEIIVVHNYTPDGTEEMVAEMAAASVVPIRYFRAAFNRPGPSRQLGAGQARGSVLAFTDDDCRATPGWIAAGVAAVQKGFALVQGQTLPDPDHRRHLLEKTVTVTGPSPFFETCNIFYDVTAFRAVGGFPLEFQALRSGEDSSLGWEIRKAGHATGFAPEALAYHAVTRVTYRKWLQEASILTPLPLLAKRYPAIRAHFFMRVFVSRFTAAFDAFVVGVLCAVLLDAFWAVLCLPYMAMRFSDRGRHRAPHILAARFLFGLPRAAAISLVLVVNSIRARRMLI